jgi:hypothetical protein
MFLILPVKCFVAASNSSRRAELFASSPRIDAVAVLSDLISSSVAAAGAGAGGWGPANDDEVEVVEFESASSVSLVGPVTFCDAVLGPWAKFSREQRLLVVLKLSFAPSIYEKTRTPILKIRMNRSAIEKTERYTISLK